MVFTSIPAYLDPINWQQQQQQQQQLQQNHPIGSSGNTSSNPHHVPPQIPSRQPPPPPQLPTQPTHVVGSGTTTGSIRPGSMADRARMANIPMPEAALKCPRCDSANTKFCYFNNYSLSQPRHFCKTCRRYWTRGGALRNVPVGGGCRRNKRSKGSSSKSPATSSDRSATPSSSAASTSSMNSASVADILGLTTQVPPLRLMPPLSSLTDYGGAGEIGLSYTGITPPVSDISFQLGSSFTLGGGGGSGGIMGGTSSFLSPPPLHFPLFAGLDATTSLYPFEGSVQEMSSFGSQLRPKLPDSGVASHQVAPVKMEENQELNLSRQFLGIQGSDQYWGGGSGGAGGSGSAWTDLSGLNSSSSTSNAL